MSIAQYRWFLLQIAIGFSLVGTTLADDFLIASRVQVGNDGKNIVESTTMFHGGRVYDFLASPDEVTIFDPPGNKFVVLDTEKQIKTEIGTAEIEAFAKKIQAEALARPVPLLEFLAKPKFDESFDDGSGELSLVSPWMDYRVKTVPPKQPDAASKYADFNNWQTKLNTLMRPGSFPPFARLELNAALDRLHRLPTEVQVTRYSQHPSKRQATIRADHRLQWRLVDSDLKRIDEVAISLATFREVSLADYRAAQGESASGE
ncbi:MAG TPA: hypothetical protein VHZ24_22035 [Pirellulales bacterium]|nr:hypothetical protein [Pirellulales bacterium]